MDLGKHIEDALRSGPPTELDPDDARVVDLQPLAASGAEAAAVRFGDGSRAFAKRYLGADAADRLHGEAAGLLALGRTLAAVRADAAFHLTAPRVLRSDPSSGLLLCEWVATAAGARREAACAAALASMQRKAIHDSPVDHGFEVTTFLGDTPQTNEAAEDWATFFVEHRLRAMLSLLTPVAPARLLDGLETLCAKAPAVLSEAPEPSVLLHGDLWSGNLLWTERGAAVIDPAAYWGHREAELGMLTLFGGMGSRFYESYQQAWPLQPGWQRRVAIYRLYHVLNHRVLFGSSYDAPAVGLIDQISSSG